MISEKLPHQSTLITAEDTEEFHTYDYVYDHNNFLGGNVENS